MKCWCFKYSLLPLPGPENYAMLAVKTAVSIEIKDFPPFVAENNFARRLISVRRDFMSNSKFLLAIIV